MARALYREWFVHFRFPGHEKLPLVASPLGDIPQGWEVTDSRRFAQRKRIQTGPFGSQLHESDYSDEGVRLSCRETSSVSVSEPTTSRASPKQQPTNSVAIGCNRGHRLRTAWRHRSSCVSHAVSNRLVLAGRLPTHSAKPASGGRLVLFNYLGQDDVVGHRKSRSRCDHA